MPPVHPLARRRATRSATIALAAAILAGCGDAAPAAQPRTASRTIDIASDLPLDGWAKSSSDEANNAMRLYLSQVQHKAGRFTVSLKIYDDSTPSRGNWDDEACVRNAVAHVRGSEVAVMGPDDSGCARLMVPVMNAVSNGPLLMVSHSSTNPGLTKAWGPDEPQKFAASGRRSFARVAATDDLAGVAAAAYITGTLHASRCYILNDGGLYGLGTARAFAAAAERRGITVLGDKSWPVAATSYIAMFEKIRALRPDCVYLAGSIDNNGMQVIRDKVGVLGDNARVALVATDGFSSDARMDAMPQASGMVVTVGGDSVDQAVRSSPAAATFVAAYKQRYGSAIATAYTLEAVAALQVILAAVEASDGSRASVDAAVFGAANLTVPAAISITGRDITINRSTGDSTSATMTILTVRAGTEAFVSSETVS